MRVCIDKAIERYCKMSKSKYSELEAQINDLKTRLNEKYKRQVDKAEERVNERIVKLIE